MIVMKREKEKIVALNNYIHETSSSGCEVVKENAFIAGFEIADRTMLEKVCEFFEPRLIAFIGREDAEELITAFRQAMKGE